MTVNPGPINRRRLIIALVCFAIWQVFLGALVVIGFERIAEDRADDCADALDIRHESMENDLRNFRALAAEFPEVDPELVDHFLMTVERGYRELPPPVTCDDDHVDVGSIESEG